MAIKQIMRLHPVNLSVVSDRKFNRLHTVKAWTASFRDYNKSPADLLKPTKITNFPFVSGFLPLPTLMHRFPSWSEQDHMYVRANDYD